MVLKRTLLVFLCIFLILTLLITGIAVYYYADIFSNELNADFFGTMFKNYPIWEYYFSKTPDWYVPLDAPSLSIDEFWYISARGTYCGMLKYSAWKDTYLFDISYTAKNIHSEQGLITINSGVKAEKAFYSEFSYYLAQNRRKFKIGEEYLLALVHTLNYNQEFVGIYVFAPLDGEYPYIEVYPGAIKYDATYFGSETKYVTKDEFCDMVFAYREESIPSTTY